MKMAITTLIIWPRDTSKAPRIIDFKPGAVNLITGASRSGKSALIRIIDYCLGSRGCEIPKYGPIRPSSSWYGLVLETAEGSKLITRRDPELQESTDDYFISEGNIRIPEIPEKNASREAIVGMLERLGQLPRVNNDFYGTGSGFKARAGFGDLKSFLFQPQWIVANSETLFFEADKEEHARKLREIFPLVLGAIDSELLVRQHRLVEVKRSLERKKRQLEAARAAVRDFAGEIRGRYTAALKLGLVDGNKDHVATFDVQSLVQRLRDAMDAWLEGPRHPESGDLFIVSERLAQLQKVEAEQSTELANLRLRLNQLLRLSDTTGVMGSNATRKMDRLTAVSWISEKLNAAHVCPVCGSETDSAAKELQSLRVASLHVAQQLKGLRSVEAVLDAEELEIRKRMRSVDEKLRHTRSERRVIEQESKHSRQLNEQRALFFGRLIEFMEIQKNISDVSDLASEIRNLEGEVGELERHVDYELIAQRKEAALFQLSQYTQHYGRIMSLETGDDLIQLDTARLTIRMISQTGRIAWLNEIGSGANWLGYHVASLLALHEFFLMQNISYVPSLLVLDQPSQTQFPDDSDDEGQHEEIREVRKAFEACASAIDRTNGRLQVIVTEHAFGRVVSGIERVHVVERWRMGRKLIPWHWDESALAEMVGKRADHALEDILDTVLEPSLRRILGILETHKIWPVKAVFSNQGIDFDVAVGIPNSRAVEYISGTVHRDLSITIS